ncbi:trehalose-phosphatase [Gymnodinialimonas ulvae]|uniref:trehalose-phosphatase n=1 Tax=Gymnodinialimonas ulvae TaxID=3126504 RepID=UPI00309E1F00
MTADVSPARPLPPRHGASLFLDFDGTLVDIAPRPDLVEVSARVTRFLEDALVALDGRVAMVSGRSVDDLRHFLPVAGLLHVGGHGAEHVDADGQRHTRDDWRRTAQALAARARAGASARLMIEEKPTGIALHFRTHPEAEEEANTLARTLAADAPDFTLQHGHCVVELRPQSASKRGAVERMMDAAPFQGTTPLFAGDDLTDQPAMEYCRSVGGDGLWIGANPPPYAGLHVARPADLLSHLELWIGQPGVTGAAP